MCINLYLWLGLADQTKTLTLSHPSIYYVLFFFFLLIDSLEAGWSFHGNCFHSLSASKARLLLNSQPAFFFFPSIPLLFKLPLSISSHLPLSSWRLQMRRVGKHRVDTKHAACWKWDLNIKPMVSYKLIKPIGKKSIPVILDFFRNVLL